MSSPRAVSFAVSAIVASRSSEWTKSMNGRERKLLLCVSKRLCPGAVETREEPLEVGSSDQVEREIWWTPSSTSSSRRRSANRPTIAPTSRNANAVVTYPTKLSGLSPDNDHASVSASPIAAELTPPLNPNLIAHIAIGTTNNSALSEARSSTTRRPPIAAVSTTIAAITQRRSPVRGDRSQLARQSRPCQERRRCMRHLLSAAARADLTPFSNPRTLQTSYITSWDLTPARSLWPR